MTHEKTLVLYKSVTGFTRAYAEMIAQEIDCTLMELKDAAAEKILGFDTVVFGGRLRGGTVDGLKKAKSLFAQSQAKKLVIFATGATPNEAREVIEEMWSNVLTPAEQREIPHFYMQSGLRYERMPFSDRLIMKMFGVMMNRKKEKTEYEKQMAQAIQGSFDHSSKAFIQPLVALLQSGQTG